MKIDNRSPKDIIQAFGTMLEEKLIPIGFKFLRSTKTLKLTLKGYDLSFSLLSDYNNRQAEWVYLNSCCFNVKHKDFSKWYNRYLSLDNSTVYNECFGHRWSLLYEEEQKKALTEIMDIIDKAVLPIITDLNNNTESFYCKIASFYLKYPIDDKFISTTAFLLYNERRELVQNCLPIIFKNLGNEEIMMLNTAYDLIKQSSNISTYNCKRMIVKEGFGMINYFYPLARLLLLYSIEIKHITNGSTASKFG